MDILRMNDLEMIYIYFNSDKKYTVETKVHDILYGDGTIDTNVKFHKIVPNKGCDEFDTLTNLPEDNWANGYFVCFDHQRKYLYVQQTKELKKEDAKFKPEVKHVILVPKGLDWDLSQITQFKMMHPQYSQLEASIEEKVEMLAKNPYRWYVGVNMWIMQGESRIDHLNELLEMATKDEKYELCIRIKEVIQLLSEKYQLESA